MLENFSTQFLCNIGVYGHEVSDIRQYAGSLSDGCQMMNDAWPLKRKANRIP